MYIELMSLSGVLKFSEEFAGINLPDNKLTLDPVKDANEATIFFYTSWDRLFSAVLKIIEPDKARLEPWIRDKLDLCSFSEIITIFRRGLGFFTGEYLSFHRGADCPYHTSAQHLLRLGEMATFIEKQTGSKITFSTDILGSSEESGWNTDSIYFHYQGCKGSQKRSHERLVGIFKGLIQEQGYEDRMDHYARYLIQMGKIQDAIMCAHLIVDPPSPEYPLVSQGSVTTCLEDVEKTKDALDLLLKMWKQWALERPVDYKYFYVTIIPHMDNLADAHAFLRTVIPSLKYPNYSNVDGYIAFLKGERGRLFGENE